MINSKLNTEMIIFLTLNRCHDRLIKKEIPTARHIELHELFSQSLYIPVRWYQVKTTNKNNIIRLSSNNLIINHYFVPKPESELFL